MTFTRLSGILCKASVGYYGTEVRLTIRDPYPGGALSTLPTEMLAPPGFFVLLAATSPSSTMSIIRTEKSRETPYAMIDRRVLEDGDLSWKAKGLLAYLLSRPDDWKVHPSQLQTVSTDGRDATYSGLSELHEAGYIEKTQRRDENGHFDGYEYVVREQARDTDSPDTENPDTGNPDTDSPDTENPSPTNKEETQRKEGNKGSSGGGAPAREGAQGDSVPAPDVEVDVSGADAASLLPDAYSVYEPEVRACLERYDESMADQLVRNQFGPGNTFSTSSVADLAESHDWPLFVLAVVLTANEATRPNLRYVQTICERGATPPSSPKLNSNRQPNGTDAKQHPAENHERIGAAIDAAFGD